MIDVHENDAPHNLMKQEKNEYCRLKSCFSNTHVADIFLILILIYSASISKNDALTVEIY